ncbi:MAG TPA: flagellar assembly protein FliW [Bacillota bacterium]|nr:flagellar assembly protein FliW [Bacillota bacterium]
MQIKTKFFGMVECEAKMIFQFPQGIPGFETEHRFLLIQPENSTFSCLQSLEKEAVAFITVSPFLICPDYSFELDEVTVANLELDKLEDALVLAIVTIPDQNPRDTTLNLKAPIIINRLTHRGSQVVVNENYPLRAPLVKEG